MDTKRTTDSILTALTGEVEARKRLSKEVWMEAAFSLNLLLSRDHELLEDLRQKVAQKKLDILKVQEKRNVAAADLEVEASEEYKTFKLQEHKVNRVEEFIKIAKKNSNEY